MKRSSCLKLRATCFITLHELLQLSFPIPSRFLLSATKQTHQSRDSEPRSKTSWQHFLSEMRASMQCLSMSKSRMMCTKHSRRCSVVRCPWSASSWRNLLIFFSSTSNKTPHKCNNVLWHPKPNWKLICGCKIQVLPMDGSFSAELRSDLLCSLWLDVI